MNSQGAPERSAPSHWIERKKTPRASRLPLRIKVLEDLHGFGLILLLGEAGNVLCLNTYLHVYSEDCKVIYTIISYYFSRIM